MCTRVYNNFNLEYLTTARNMDWATQLPTTIFSFCTDKENPTHKIGVSKADNINKQCALKWEATYDSLVTMVGPDTDYGASDGINSAGLVANALYDSNATYGQPSVQPNSNLSILRWVQFVLDTCGSVEDVVNTFGPNAEHKIRLVTAIVPGSNKEASIHLSVSDDQGYSAIIEANNGQYQIYSDIGKHVSFRIMTNEPSYAKQIILNQYWRWQWSKENIFPSNTLPGGPFAPDRFARASFYVNHLHAPESNAESAAQSKSVVMNASVPVAFNSEELKISQMHPNISQTLWSTIGCHNTLQYYFYNSRTQNTVWLDMTNERPKGASFVNMVTYENEKFTNIATFNGEINTKLKETQDPYSVDVFNLVETPEEVYA